MFPLALDSNSSSLDSALASFQSSLADLSPALREISDDFREMIAEQFASEGRAGGTPWAPLEPSTVRRRRGHAAPILFDTGALFHSFRDPGAPGHVEEIDGETLLIGSRLPYAPFHQTGTGWGLGLSRSPAPPRRGRGMPARPIIVVTADRQNAWAEIVLRHLEENFRVLQSPELGGSTFRK